MINSRHETYTQQKKYYLSCRHCCIDTNIDRKIPENRIISVIKRKSKKDTLKAIDFIKLKFIISKLEYLDVLSLSHNIFHFWELHDFDYFILQFITNEIYSDVS